MNREKKQLVVVGVLVALILAVGAFQFMRGSSDTPPPTEPKKAKPEGSEGTTAEKPKPKNENLLPLAAKDPFTPAAFISEGTTPPNNPTPPVKQESTHGSRNIKLPGVGDFTEPMDWQPGGKKDIVKPAEPPKPVFGYDLVGIVEGAHPMAVFEDAAGNQQLVEVGQGIGPSATLTNISRGTVRVKFNAETLVFNVGGNPHAK